MPSLESPSTRKEHGAKTTFGARLKRWFGGSKGAPREAKQGESHASDESDQEGKQHAGSKAPAQGGPASPSTRHTQEAEVQVGKPFRISCDVGVQVGKGLETEKAPAPSAPLTDSGSAAAAAPTSNGGPPPTASQPAAAAPAAAPQPAVAAAPAGAAPAVEPQAANTAAQPLAGRASEDADAAAGGASMSRPHGMTDEEFAALVAAHKDASKRLLELRRRRADACAMGPGSGSGPLPSVGPSADHSAPTTGGTVGDATSAPHTPTSAAAKGGAGGVAAPASPGPLPKASSWKEEGYAASSEEDDELLGTGYGQWRGGAGHIHGEGKLAERRLRPWTKKRARALLEKHSAAAQHLLRARSSALGAKLGAMEAGGGTGSMPGGSLQQPAWARQTSNSLPETPDLRGPLRSGGSGLLNTTDFHDMLLLETAPADIIFHDASGAGAGTGVKPSSSKGSLAGMKSSGSRGALAAAAGSARSSLEVTSGTAAVVGSPPGGSRTASGTGPTTGPATSAATGGTGTTEGPGSSASGKAGLPDADLALLEALVPVPWPMAQAGAARQHRSRHGLASASVGAGSGGAGPGSAGDLGAGGGLLGSTLNTLSALPPLPETESVTLSVGGMLQGSTSGASGGSAGAAAARDGTGPSLAALVAAAAEGAPHDASLPATHPGCMTMGPGSVGSGTGSTNSGATAPGSVQQLPPLLQRAYASVAVVSGVAAAAGADGQTPGAPGAALAMPKASSLRKHEKLLIRAGVPERVVAALAWAEREVRSQTKAAQRRSLQLDMRAAGAAAAAASEATVTPTASVTAAGPGSPKVAATAPAPTAAASEQAAQA